MIYLADSVFHIRTLRIRYTRLVTTSLCHAVVTATLCHVVFLFFEINRILPRICITQHWSANYCASEKAFSKVGSQVQERQFRTKQHWKDEALFWGNFRIKQNLNFRCKPNYCVLYDCKKKFTVVEMRYKFSYVTDKVLFIKQRIGACLYFCNIICKLDLQKYDLLAYEQAHLWVTCELRRAKRSSGKESGGRLCPNVSPRAG